MCGAVRVRVADSLRLLPTTTRLNGKREQRCPLRFHMSSVFENRQARCAHLRRTRQKIQFGSKDQRLFAHKGKAHTYTSDRTAPRRSLTSIYFYLINFLLLLYCRSTIVFGPAADARKSRRPYGPRNERGRGWVEDKNSGGDFRFHRPY